MSYKFRQQNVLHDEAPGLLQSGIEIQRRQNRFERVHEQSCLSAPSALFFAAAKNQVLAEIERSRHLRQVLFAYQVCAEFRQLPLGEVRETAEQFFAGDEPQNGITQEFELFIVINSGAASLLFEFGLAGVRAVGESPSKQFRPVEAVTQRFFQTRKIGLTDKLESWQGSSIINSSGSITCKPRSTQPSPTGLRGSASMRLHGLWLRRGR